MQGRLVVNLALATALLAPAAMAQNGTAGAQPGGFGINGAGVNGNFNPSGGVNGSNPGGVNGSNPGGVNATNPSGFNSGAGLGADVTLPGNSNIGTRGTRNETGGRDFNRGMMGSDRAGYG